jgi:hypothetical protein
MPKTKRAAPSERIGAGKPITMPDFKYQEYPGKSGGISPDKRETRTERLAALQNFVPRV